MDEDVEYTGKQLDKDIVNPSTIRTIIRGSEEPASGDFSPTGSIPRKFEVPKMLIFAKTDSHAEDIMEVVRKEFNEMISVKDYIPEQGSPKTISLSVPERLLPAHRGDRGYDCHRHRHPPPGSAALYARCESRSCMNRWRARYTHLLYWRTEGEGERPTPNSLKTIFVIIDAIGVEQSQRRIAVRWRKRQCIIERGLAPYCGGDRSERMMSTLANRLLRLDKQINEHWKIAVWTKGRGRSIQQVVRMLLYAHDPDTKAYAKPLSRWNEQAGASGDW